MTALQEDPILKTMMEWIYNWKIQDLKHLLGDDTKTEEGKIILWEWKKLMLYQGALYYCHTLCGELEEVLQFVVPTAHWVTARNGCHWDVRHQGCNRHCACYMTSSDGQVWPCRCRRQSAAVSNASSMTKVIRKPQCDQSLLSHLWSCYMLTLPALWPWWSWINPQMWWTFWSFVTTLWNMSWHMWPLIKLQKLLLIFLWQGYISVFGAPAMFLSDWGDNFKSNIIRELCEFIDIWKVKTSPYHA